MARTPGATGFRLKDLLLISEILKRKSNGKRPRWNSIFVDTGYNLERLGRKLRGFSKKKPRTWSMDEYAALVQALRNSADIIEARAKDEDQKNYDEISQLLKE
jgi:hypothetical protein